MDLFFLFYNLLLSWFSSRVSFFNLLAAFNLSSVRFSHFFGILCFFIFGFSGFFSFNLLSFYSFCQILVSQISHSDLFYHTILFPQSFIRLLTDFFSSFHFPLSSSSTSKFQSPPHEWVHWSLFSSELWPSLIDFSFYFSPSSFPLLGWTTSPPSQSINPLSSLPNLCFFSFAFKRIVFFSVWLWRKVLEIKFMDYWFTETFICILASAKTWKQQQGFFTTYNIYIKDKH